MEKTDKEREAYYDFLIYGTTDKSLIRWYKQQEQKKNNKLEVAHDTD